MAAAETARFLLILRKRFGEGVWEADSLLPWFSRITPRHNRPGGALAGAISYLWHQAAIIASPPSFYLSSNESAAREAHMAGAVYMAKFDFDEHDWAAERQGLTIVRRSPTTWDHPAVYATDARREIGCQSCESSRIARWRVTDTRDERWTEQMLCDFCTGAALAPEAIAKAESLDSMGRGTLALAANRALAGNYRRPQATPHGMVSPSATPRSRARAAEI